MFKWDKFELNYYYLHALIRIGSGIIIALLNYTYIAGVSIGGMFFLMSLITVIKRPYSDNLQSVRSSINLLIGSVIFILYALASYNGSTSGNNFYSRTPIIVILLLYIVLFMGAGFTIRQFIMMNKI